MIQITKKSLLGTVLNNGNFFTKDRSLWNRLQETFKGKRPGKKAVLTLDGTEYSYDGHSPFSRCHGWPENYRFKSCTDDSFICIAFRAF